MRQRIEERGKRREPTAGARVAMLVGLPLLLSSLLSPLSAQSREWRPDDRTLVTDLSVVTAVAATNNVVYAATPGALAIYDRAFASLREVVGRLDGYPETPVTAMVASPTDDALWLATANGWLAYDGFLRRFDGGSLPGVVDQVVLDANDPGRGAWFHTGTGWYFVPRGGIAAMPQAPPADRIGPLSYGDLTRRVPALDAVQMRLQRDDLNRTWRLTAAAEAPLTHDLFVGTSGNGLFRLDPRSIMADRMPSGLLGTVAEAVSASRGQVCAGTDRRLGTVRRGITCFDEPLSSFTYFEVIHSAPLPGQRIHHLLVTQHAVWAATDAGLLRAPRGGGDPLLVRGANGALAAEPLALAPSARGVWVGTANGLALVADSGRGAAVAALVAGPPVLAVAERADTAWIGSTQGLLVLPPLDTVPLAVTGLPQMHETIVAIAVRGDSIVAATASRFLVRDLGGGWHVVDPAGGSIGRITALCADDRGGLWVAGTLGIAYFDPSRNLWDALTTPGDVPVPVADIAATRDYVWVATPIGVMRYRRTTFMVNGH